MNEARQHVAVAALHATCSILLIAAAPLGPTRFKPRLRLVSVQFACQHSLNNTHILVTARHLQTIADRGDASSANKVEVKVEAGELAVHLQSELEALCAGRG